MLNAQDWRFQSKTRILNFLSTNSNLPLEIFDTHRGHIIMDNSHGVDNLFFDFIIADNWVGIKEMARHSY